MLHAATSSNASFAISTRDSEEYTALLFVVADSPASLQQNLASLCDAAVLNLVEKDERETAIQVAALTRWLRRNHGRFLILDNVDSEEVVGAADVQVGLQQCFPGDSVHIRSATRGGQRAKNEARIASKRPQPHSGPNAPVFALAVPPDTLADTGL